MKRFTSLVSFVLVAMLSFPTLFAASISGKVLYFGDNTRPVGGVTVTLKQGNSNNAIQTALTGSNGMYNFNNVIPGEYIVSSSTNIPGRVPTFFDAVLVFLHLAINYPLNDMQFMASDVSGNNKVTWSDYNHIVSRILNGTPFPAGEWQFEELNITVTGLKDGVPIGGTCSGDVGGVFVPQYNTPALPLAQDGEISISNGEPFKTRIITNNSLTITGAGIIIDYPADLLNIESVEFKGTDYLYNVLDGQIRIIWGNPNTAPIHFSQGESFVTIHGTATKAFVPGMIATLGLAGNTSLVSSSNQELTNLSFASPVLKPGSPALKLDNYPNPFASSTRLSVYTPESGYAVIEIYNAAGQMVRNIQAGKMETGYHEINLDASDLARGYYICKLRIQTAGNEISSIKRLVKAE